MFDVKGIKIEDLGYDEFFESNRKKMRLGDFLIARVISEHKGAYKVKNTEGEYLAKVTGKKMFSASSREDYPAVGDWVAITKLDKENAVINDILPRKTSIKRTYGDKNRSGDKTKTQIIGTNIDTAFIVESIDRDYNLNRFERYFVLAKNGGVKPAIILNKIDLISSDELDLKLAEIKNRFGDVDVITTSVVNADGLDKLKKYITYGKTYCFLGSSGVGKSSLINKLIGENIIKTGNISSYSNRGKHVTTKREMYFLENGGIVIDNPGMREVGIINAEVGVGNLFDEMVALSKKCKYADCSHTHEPGCKILHAVKSGKLDENKYSNYINLKKETEYHEMNRFEKREKERKFGKFIKNVKKELKKYRD